MENQQTPQPLPTPSDTASLRPSLPSASEILKQSWGVYKQKLGILLKIALLPILITLISAKPYKLALENAVLGGVSKNFLIYSILSFLLFMVMILASAWSQAAMIFALKEEEEKISAFESYKKGWHKIFPLIWVGLLAFFVILGGSILFIIPGIIFGVWFSFIWFVVVDEDLNGVEALLKSSWYVRGRGVAVFWRILFLFCVGVLFILTALLLAIGLFLFLAKFSFNLTDYYFLFLVGTISLIVEFAYSLFMGPFIVVYYFLLYKHLKNTKKGETFEPSKRGRWIFIPIGLFGLSVLIIYVVSWLSNH